MMTTRAARKVKRSRASFALAIRLFRWILKGVFEISRNTSILKHALCRQGCLGLGLIQWSQTVQSAGRICLLVCFLLCSELIRTGQPFALPSSPYYDHCSLVLGGMWVSVTGLVFDDLVKFEILLQCLQTCITGSVWLVVTHDAGYTAGWWELKSSRSNCINRRWNI